MLRRTEGIVLKTFPFGEADLIVTFLTKDFGITGAFAKSPRKIKSRFGSSLEPLTYSRISLWGKEDAKLPRLTQSDIINPFQALRENYECFMRLSGMVGLTLDLLPEGEENGRAFFLLKEVLEAMENNCTTLYSILYRIRLLDLTGYAPGLGGCARCGRSGMEFYMSEGSIVCVDCAVKLEIKENSLRLSAGGLKLYGAMRSWDIPAVTRIKPTSGMLAELGAMLDSHIEYRLSKPLRVRTDHRVYLTR